MVANLEIHRRSLGFGERRWEELYYGMEHRDTTLKPLKDAVFLGMHIKRTAERLLLSVWEKGTGWTWVPQRNISYSSCHTPWTKKFLLKGLLIRAATICNTTAAFKAAALYYINGLKLRGCSNTQLTQSWDSFCSSRMQNAGRLREGLTAWFKSVLHRSNPNIELPPPRAPLARHVPDEANRSKVLLCGLHATNAILGILKRPLLQREHLDEVNLTLAEAERNLRNDRTAPDLHLQPEGNYPLQVLISVLRIYGDVELERTADSADVTPGTYLLGNGYHWQVVTHTAGTWWLHDDGLQYPVADIKQLLRDRRSRGAALLIKPRQQACTVVMDTDQASKRASATEAFGEDSELPARKQPKKSMFLQAFTPAPATPPEAVPSDPPPSAFQVPRVKCGNHRANPSQTHGRCTEHPVYLGKCTNCLRGASEKGHTPASPVYFVDEATFNEFLAQFKPLAAAEDTGVV